LNKDLVKNFAGTRLMGNFSLKRSQWKNAGHALSSEMHEFAVDWIVPAKIVNYPMNGDISGYGTINWNLHTPASLAINPQVGY
jgi:hypothetical protein